MADKLIELREALEESKLEVHEMREIIVEREQMIDKGVKSNKFGIELENKMLKKEIL